MRAAGPRRGGRILVDQLRLHGADAVFCVPGESFLEVLDALYDLGEAVRLVVCRQEGGAAAMAGAYGRVTGRPGVCLVSRAPGATNAASGVDMDFRESAPTLPGGRLVAPAGGGPVCVAGAGRRPLVGPEAKGGGGGRRPRQAAGAGRPRLRGGHLGP